MNDFLNVYFYINIFKYSSDSSFISSILMSFTGIFLSLAALLCIFLPHNVVFSTFADMCRMLSSMIVTLIMG